MLTFLHHSVTPFDLAALLAACLLIAAFAYCLGCIDQDLARESRAREERLQAALKRLEEAE